MVEQAKSWVKENSTLVYFLVAQTLALMSGLAYIVNWKADLESRVHILEERGSPHLSAINNRLTVLESMTTDNRRSIERITEIMLRELPLKKDGIGK